jgi:hypothetical protein
MKEARCCYYCGAPSTSRDHVPPKAFFPERKDLRPGSPDYRRNLLTVPSCDAHNNAASGDDQIAAYAILAHERINPVGLQHQATKVHRATRKDRTLSSRVFLRVRHELTSSGAVGLIATIDIKAVNRVLDRIARGLFFLETGTRWIQPLKVVSDSLMGSEGSRPFEGPVAQLRLAMALASQPWHGDNPEGFRYQWFRFRNSETRVLRMIFYDGFEFVAVPLDATSKGGHGSRPRDA